ncbi:NADH dehydrogenase [ubiquinone] 1 subunit C2-like [Ornithodoros turicata]
MSDSSANYNKYGSLPPYYEKLFRQTIEEKQVSLYSKVFYPGFSAVAVTASLALYNRSTNRPLYSGLPRFLVAIPIALYLGDKLRQYYQRSSAERDAMLRHYIMLHPEDFPEPERKKYKDVFETWVPER